MRREKVFVDIGKNSREYSEVAVVGEVVDMSFALRDYLTVIEAMERLISLTGLNRSLEELVQFHFAEICAEMLKLSDIPSFPVVFDVILIMSAREAWFVADLIEKAGFLSIAKRMFKSGTFIDEILSVLANCASKTERARDLVLSEFPISLLANGFRSEGNSEHRERLSVLLMNVAKHAFSCDKTRRLLIGIFRTLISRRMCVNLNILWGLHYVLFYAPVIKWKWIPDNICDIFDLGNPDVASVLCLLIGDIARFGCPHQLTSIDVYSFLRWQVDDVTKAVISCIRAMSVPPMCMPVNFTCLRAVLGNASYIGKVEIGKLIIVVVNHESPNETLSDPSLLSCIALLLDLRDQEITINLVMLVLGIHSRGIGLEFLHGHSFDDNEFVDMIPCDILDSFNSIFI